MALDLFTIAALLGLGFFAGALNAVAGGGTFFMFPSLVLLGLPPVIANITGKVALSFASIASVSAFTRELKEEGKRSRDYLWAGFLGSVVGSLLLLVTPPEGFEAMAPWLLLLAVAVFSYGSKRVVVAFSGYHLPHMASLMIQFIIGIYGGFFAAGMGLMMLALYAVSGFSSLHHMNGIKNLTGLGINLISAVIFAVSGMVHWQVALILMMGALFGGYLGAHYSRYIPQQFLRYGVMLYGASMAGYLLING